METAGHLLTVEASPAEKPQRMPRGQHVAGLIETMERALAEYRKLSHSGRVAAAKRASTISKTILQRERAKRGKA